MGIQAISYDANSDVFSRFVDHAKLGFYKNVQAHTTNLPERIGNQILWTVEELPSIVWEKIKEPKVVVVAMTVLALIADSFLFYPIRTFQAFKHVYQWLPLPPAWAFKAGVYFFSVAVIIGYGFRAYGRFSNPELMNQFYSSQVNENQNEV